MEAFIDQKFKYLNYDNKNSEKAKTEIENSFQFTVTSKYKSYKQYVGQEKFHLTGTELFTWQSLLFNVTKFSTIKNIYPNLVHKLFEIEDKQLTGKDTENQ